MVDRVSLQIVLPGRRLAELVVPADFSAEDYRKIHAWLTFHRDVLLGEEDGE